MVLIFRQGDIILKEISLDRLAFDNKSKEAIVYNDIKKYNHLLIQNGYENIHTNIVAMGEATGHSQSFIDGNTVLYKRKGQSNSAALVVVT